MQIPIILIQVKHFGLLHTQPQTLQHISSAQSSSPGSWWELGKVRSGSVSLRLSKIHQLSSTTRHQEPSSCASLCSTSSSRPMQSVPITLFPTGTSEQRRKTSVEHTALFIIPLMRSRAAPELPRKQIPSQQLESSCAFCKLHIQPCRLKVPTEISLSYQHNHQLFLGFYFSKVNAMPGKGV